MNNAIYGKTMENLRKRADIELVDDWKGTKGARMLIAQPNFKRCKIFDESLVAIEMSKIHVLMNKPIIVGMCVLDISKITMYKFLYDYLKPKYGNNVEVAYTDTDSFVISVKTNDFYEDMRLNSDKFDTSDYPWPNEFNIERKNKKKPGLFKDELNGHIMCEFVGLRAKCYALRTLNDKMLDDELKKKLKKAKGVKRNVLRRKLTFDNYVDCITLNCEVREKQNTIRSIKHNVYSIEQEKTALSPFDEKRYIIRSRDGGGIQTYAWGHFGIKERERKRKLPMPNLSSI